MIGVIGDPHFREYLAYADYVKDRREGERTAVLDAVVDAFADCDTIVFMGDNFDTKTNPSQVVRAFTAFVERFAGKQVYIIAGNHEKTASGKTAIDYLKEIKNENWHIVTDSVETYGPMTLVPYFYKQELGVQTYEEATQALMGIIRSAGNNFSSKHQPILLTHHAVSDTLVHSGESTNLFQEIVLPKTELESMFRFVIGGHIHQPGQYGRTIVTGSLMSNEAGDGQKSVWKIDLRNEKVIEVKLPNRVIYRFENPTLDDLRALTNGNIVKVVLTERGTDVEQLREELKRFDAYVLLEQYKAERAKTDMQGAMPELTIPNLLHLFANQKKYDADKLMQAWGEIA